MKWSAIAASEPALDAVVFDRLIRPGVLLAGTVRRDGSPRISGAGPLVMDGDLWLSMMRTSVKVMDLARDPRILLHSIVTGPEPTAEVKVRGTVRAEDDPGVQRRYAAAHVASWPAGLEYVRPSVTPTSLGPQQPVRRLLG
jgi:Pyridoxamine 5'-phosphate oxidase